MNEQDFRRIADKTNKLMKSRFDSDHRPGSKTDIIIMEPQRSWIWEACEPFLSELPDIWDYWKKENEEFRNAQPYISALDKLKIIDILYKKLDMLVVRERMKRDRIVLENWDLAIDMMKDSPFNIVDDISSVSVEYKIPKKVELKNGQTLGEWNPSPREEKAVIYRLSEQILKECHIHSIDDYE